jgi:hypothetical protein
VVCGAQASSGTGRSEGEQVTFAKTDGHCSCTNKSDGQEKVGGKGATDGDLELKNSSYGGALNLWRDFLGIVFVSVRRCKSNKKKCQDHVSSNVLLFSLCT